MKQWLGLAGLMVFVAAVTPACASADDAQNGDGTADESQDELRAAKCGGIAGLQCKQGYECVITANYPDAMGTCKKQKTCGGFAGIQCPTGYDCVTESAYPDAMGVCEKHVDPPCGMKAVTTTCAHGYAFDTKTCQCEPTKPPTDPCGGCATGKYCSACWGHYACIPNGAMC